MTNLFSSSCFLMCATVWILMLLGTATTVRGSIGGDQQLGWLPVLPTTGSPYCSGSMAECMAVDVEEEEFGMDSEINRRILATSKHISYGALQKNNVPCSKRGASYYNCKPGAQANPYSRGCSAITRCRG